MSDAPDWEGFGRDLMQDWPVGDVDGSELFDAALRTGLIREIPGGYDPEQHIDAECICPEAGDPWYEYAFGSRRADLPATDAQAMANPKVVAMVEALRLAEAALNGADVSMDVVKREVNAALDDALAHYKNQFIAMMEDDT